VDVFRRVLHSLYFEPVRGVKWWPELCAIGLNDLDCWQMFKMPYGTMSRGKLGRGM
jgi:hypothetical protein